ncbi:MAG: hypothetical protein ACOC6R_00420 [Chloroflexota bacterium]
MLIISKEALQSAMSLKEKIADVEKRAECIADVENMIKIKESHIARAELASCCDNICNLVPQIESELQMLQKILEVLRNGDSTKAHSLLEDYIGFLQESYSPQPDHW